MRKRPGPKPLFTAQKKQAVANAAMAMDRRGEAVSVEQVQARTPKASCNPKTGAPFTKKYILQVSRDRCLGLLRPKRLGLVPVQFGKLMKRNIEKIFCFYIL